MTIEAARPIGTATQTTPKPMMMLFHSPYIMSRSFRRSLNQCKVNPLKGWAVG
jgi:hypothetical protein